jgi:hypothetical protein
MGNSSHHDCYQPGCHNQVAWSTNSCYCPGHRAQEDSTVWDGRDVTKDTMPYDPHTNAAAELPGLTTTIPVTQEVHHELLNLAIKRGCDINELLKRLIASYKSTRDALIVMDPNFSTWRNR